MSFEDPPAVFSFSYPGGEPPTPDRTPTSPNFFLNSFETPRQESRFVDPRSPWSSAFANVLGHTPTQRIFSTPSKTPTTPVLKQQFLGHDIEAEISSHVHSQTSTRESPPPKPTPHPSASTNPSLTLDSKQSRLHTSESVSTPLKPGLDPETTSSMQSAGSIQTPPPTSTSASRRKAQQGQIARRSKESVVKGRRRMSTPAPANQVNEDELVSHVQESPSHFPNLQFSPDGPGFPMTGPATAPVYPQHKLFWDPEQGTDSMNMDFTMDDSFNAFGIGSQKSQDPFVSHIDHSASFCFPTTPSFTATAHESSRRNNVAPLSRAVSFHQTSPSAKITHGPSHGKVATLGVNPSLLFSSPSRTPENNGISSSSQIIQDDPLQPYAHQLRDAQVERDLRSRKAKRKRDTVSDSPAVMAAIEALRDDQNGRTSRRQSIADNAVVQSNRRLRPSRNNSGHLNTNQMAVQNVLNRQESQSKPHRRDSRSQHRKRTAVTLTIDASGRAKTQATLLDEGKPPANEMEIDSGSEDSDSSTSSAGAGMAMSFGQSFNPSVPKRRKPKLGQFARDPKAHSQKSSYASTRASTNTVNTIPGSRLGPRLSTSSRRHRLENGFSGNGYLNAGQGDEESEAETIIDSDDDKGNAQSELKKVRAQNQANHRSSFSAPKLGIAEQRLSYYPQPTSASPYYFPQRPTNNQHEYPKIYTDISPTTITDPELTPNSGQGSNFSSSSTRCICHTAEDDGQPMILCESCKKWLHISCVRLNPQKLPTVYLCIFCTGSTPNVRGGRVREPARATFAPPGSPLAHKSHRYR